MTIIRKKDVNEGMTLYIADMLKSKKYDAAASDDSSDDDFIAGLKNLRKDCNAGDKGAFGISAEKIFSLEAVSHILSEELMLIEERVELFVLTAEQAEFVEIMATLYPGLYSKDHAMWDQASFGSKVLNGGTDTSIKDWINFYRPQLPLVEEVAAFVPYFPSNGELLAVANSSRDIIKEYNLTPELFQANGDVFFVMVFCYGSRKNTG